MGFDLWKKYISVLYTNIFLLVGILVESGQ